MNKETAKKILEIMLTADRGCEFCVRGTLFKVYKRIPRICLSCKKEI
jgi:uncharacterized protein (DUF983 family)